MDISIGADATIAIQPSHRDSVIVDVMRPDGTDDTLWLDEPAARELADLLTRTLEDFPAQPDPDAAYDRLVDERLDGQ